MIKRLMFVATVLTFSLGSGAAMAACTVSVSGGTATCGGTNAAGAACGWSMGKGGAWSCALSKKGVKLRAAIPESEWKKSNPVMKK